MIRTTFLGSSIGAQQRLMERSAAASRAAARLSSGKQFSRPSEDPAAASTALAFRSELNALKSFQSTAEEAQSRLDITDAKLDEVQTVIARLKELAVGASTGTMDQQGREATAAEVSQLRDHLVGLANARHLDQPLFAGFATTDAVDFVSGAWQFTGSSTETMERRVSDSDTVQINVVASEVFQANSADAFTMLDTFIASLNSGDVTGVRDAVDEIDALRSSVSTARSRIGAATNRIENVLDANISRQTIVRADLSEVEDIDLVEGITEANRQQAAYEAALGATAKFISKSLVDFLA